MVYFDLEKKSEGSFRDEAPPSRGRTNLGLRRSCSARETSLQEGEIVIIVITIDPLIGRGVHLHQHLHQHHLLSNPSSSLVSNLCLKTSGWYLWIASSVDYSL